MWILTLTTEYHLIEVRNVKVLGGLTKGFTDVVKCKVVVEYSKEMLE